METINNASAISEVSQGNGAPMNSSHVALESVPIKIPTSRLKQLQRELHHTWGLTSRADLPTCRPADLPTCRPADLPTC